MAETTIEWTTYKRPDGSIVPGYTFNAWRGCTKVSTGCAGCYAEQWSSRNHKTLGTWGPKGERVIAAEGYWRQPLRWNREAQVAGERRRVFCASLADVFEGRETMPAEAWEAVQAARQRLFTLALQTKWLDWLFLTKRPENIRPILSQLTHPEHPNTDWWTLQERQPRPNWWFGTSVEDQQAADKRIPHLLKVPAAVRFLSCEPLLSSVNLRRFLWSFDENASRDMGAPVDTPTGEIGWVICGGESGPNARPMHADWARKLRDQCAEAGTPFLFKQHGEYLHESQYPDMAQPLDPDTWDHLPMPAAVPHREEYRRLGKKLAGRILDGRTWDEYPIPR